MCSHRRSHMQRYMAAIPASYWHGVWVGETTRKHFVILTLTIYTSPTPSPFLCVCEPDNNIGDAAVTALAPSLKGLSSLTVLNLGGEWVIGCVVTVDRISSDTWPLTPRVIGTGVGWWQTPCNPHPHYLHFTLTLSLCVNQQTGLVVPGPPHSPLP